MDELLPCEICSGPRPGGNGDRLCDTCRERLRVLGEIMTQSWDVARTVGWLDGLFTDEISFGLIHSRAERARECILKGKGWADFLAQEALADVVLAVAAYFAGLNWDLPRVLLSRMRELHEGVKTSQEEDDKCQDD